MKRAEKQKVTIGEYDFYVSKFGAFKAANLSGELARLFSPVIAACVPAIVKLVGNQSGDEDAKPEDNSSIFDKELGDIVPAFAGAFKHLSGNDLENIMRRLLIDEKNVSFVEKGCMDANQCKVLEWEDADELFCGDLQDMYQLAIKVIQLNYKGFFSKLAGQYGLDLEKAGAVMIASQNMEHLMSVNSAS